MRIDRIDRQLLKLVQERGDLTADRLAEMVGRSPSVIARRLRRLRADKVITGHTAIVDAKALGGRAWTAVYIQLERREPRASESLRRQLAEEPRVQLIVDIAGDYDILLLVVSRDLEDYTAFSDRTLADSPAVRRFESRFVKKMWKQSTLIPVELDSPGTG